MPCPICEFAGAQLQEVGGTTRVRCRRCGHYDITEEAAEDWENIWAHLSPRQRANVWGWIRDRPGILIRSELLESLRQIPTPPVSERADKLLMEMERRSEVSGQLLQVHDSDDAVVDYSGVAWAIDRDELKFLARKFLGEARGFLFHGQASAGLYAVMPNGYVHLEELRRVNADSDIGFAAMWFDQEVGQLWAQGIEPAIRGARYRPVRIDQHEHNNRIDDEIIAMIRKSRFLVADYTGSRGGVYFEAGYAMGAGLPVIWTCREDWMAQLHFDVRQYSFLIWTAAELLDFRDRLRNRIEATIGTGHYVPPR